MNPILGSALALRRRSVWEAIDSGLLLWRNNFVYFIPFFAVPVWIIACSLRFLPDDFKYLSYLMIWWLKPLFDRLLLHVVSVRFFVAGERARPGPEAKTGLEWSNPSSHSSSSDRSRGLRKGLWGNLGRGLLGDLFWRRFNSGRSARMPIRVLERLGGKQFRQRKKALVSGGLGFGSFVSFLGLLAEIILLAGEFAFVLFIMQMFFPSVSINLRDNFETVEIFIFAAYCFNFILIESLYVCMGFGLYVNCRVEVEGWDLQILFQKFSRLASGGKPRKFSRERPGLLEGSVSRAVLAVCFFLALLAVPVPLYASEDAEPIEYFPVDFPFAPEESLEKLKGILESDDFGSEREGWGLRFKQNDKKATELPDINLAPWMEKLRQAFSFILRFLVVLVIAALVILVLFWLSKKQLNLFRKKESYESYVEPFFSPLDPELLFNRAEDLFSLGKLREAWAACFSACIGAYVRYHSLSFPGDVTEYGCLDLVRRALPDEEGEFGILVRSWVLFAYGGRAPAEGTFERALAYGRSIKVKYDES